MFGRSFGLAGLCLALASAPAPLLAQDAPAADPPLDTPPSVDPVAPAAPGPDADTSVTPPNADASPSVAPPPDASANADVNASATADAEAEAMALALSASDGDTDNAVAEVEEFKLNIYGFTDFTYTHLLNDFAFASPYPTFLIGNVNLYVGADLGDGWRSLTEFRLLYLPHGSIPAAEAFSPTAVRTDTTVGDPADLGRPQRWGGVEIERAWLEYRAHPLLTIRAGQWLTPYGIWNVDHGSPVIIGVRRPYVVGESLIPERQTGVMVYGSQLVGQTELGYVFGLSNGRGPLDAYQDLDNNKAVTARLSVTNESPIGNLAAGFTVYRGRFTDRQSRFAVDSAGRFGMEWISSQRYEELSLSGDLKWVWEDVTLQGEFMMRDTAMDDRVRAAAFGGPPGFVPDFRSVGFYVLAAYRLPWLNITPFFGGEQYDPGQEFAPDAAALWGGLNIRPTPRVVLKAQYTESWFTDDTDLVGDDGTQALDLQAAWSF